MCTCCRRTLRETLDVGKQHEPQLAPHESASCGRDRELERRVSRQRLTGLEVARIDLAQKLCLPEGLAAVGECDDDSVARADERLELVLGLRQPAGRDRRSLGFERE